MLCRDWKDHVCYFATWLEGYSIIRVHYFLHSEKRKTGIEDIALQTCAYAMELHQEILVFNNGNWSSGHALWKGVQKSDWKDVILDTTTKYRLRSDVENFCNGRDVFKHLGIPCKHGTVKPPLSPGHTNILTISIKALMKSISYPSLYIISFKSYIYEEYSMVAAFDSAQAFMPYMLILEDLESKNIGNF
ncbi:hypothetical protein C7212DRAFT_285974 [Tuber magnatum]|uniref:Uncharacterized protein n=1 Tax=Tuber magnatum TaxID=42249 RepID=A0A317SFG7_9PEZI|nr:hypothetical protein C7212DRAFT_285974 [Tuber magnatum]